MAEEANGGCACGAADERRAAGGGDAPGRTTERTAEARQSLVNRLSRIEGQIRGLRGMVEKSAYCPDILVQSSAAEAAIRAFNRALLAGHIRSCVARDIRRGEDAAIEELVALLPKLMK